MRPFGRWLLIEKHVAQTTTKSGLVIPKESVEKVVSGTVLAVSSQLSQERESFLAEQAMADEVSDFPLPALYHIDTIEEGDVVVFPEYAGMDYRIEDRTMFLKHEDIVAVI